MKTIIRINMKNQSASFEESPAAYYHLGGRGLTSKIVSCEVPPNCDPFDPENKLVLAPGLLSGTKAPSSGRMSIGGKSPLTGGIKEANVGGNIGQTLAKLEIKAVIIEDQPEPENWFVVEVTKTAVQFKPAGNIKDLDNYQVGEYLMSTYGDKVLYLSIGSAGVMQLPIASIASGDQHGRPTRHAGRGGLGAVMGSKNVKAIVFLETSDHMILPMANRELCDETRIKFTREMVKMRKPLTKYGTAVMLEMINHFGALPVNNFRGRKLEDCSSLSGEKMAENCKSRGGKTGHACHKGCAIRCSNVYHDKDGEYLTSALEFETIGLLGPNCGITDFDQIAEIDRLCDDYGMDTMELGGTLGVCMEGKLLEFGDFDGMKRLIGEIRKGTVTGRLLGQGTTVTGKTLGVKRIPAVKGQSMAAYEPRVLQGTGVTYATSPMGADHTAGNCVPGRTGIDDRSGTGQVPAAVKIQLITTLIDNLGFCIFVGTVPENIDVLTIFFNAYLGLDWTEEQVLKIGEDIIKEEMAFNEKAGISRYQNDLPRFFRTEKIFDEYAFDVDRGEMRNIYAS